MCLPLVCNAACADRYTAGATKGVLWLIDDGKHNLTFNHTCSATCQTVIAYPEPVGLQKMATLPCT